MQIGTTCQSHGISKVYASSILPSTRTSIDIGQINEVINCTNSTKSREAPYMPLICYAKIGLKEIKIRSPGKLVLGHSKIRLEINLIIN